MRLSLTSWALAGLLAACAVSLAGCGPTARPAVTVVTTPASTVTPETLPAAGAGGSATLSSPSAAATALPAATGQTTATLASATGTMTTTAPMTTTMAAPEATTATTTTLAASGSPASAPVSPDVLYQADFTNKASGWPDNLKFDNYYVGYHEPDNYHVEVHTPNDNALVVVPGRTFDNFAVEAQAFTVVPATAPNGDFRYGLVFRRAGNHYYAFVISPRSKTWYVLKNSSTGLQVLGQGKQDAIQGLQAPDILRVNAQGSTFDFFINNQPVAQFSDKDYTNGEIGFYVETFDAPKAHIHYHALVVRKAQNPLPPQVPTCKVNSQYLNLRRGPSVYYDPPITALANGTRMQALGRSPDQWWIQVRVADTGQQGWVSSLDTFVTCDVPVSSLPVLGPS